MLRVAAVALVLAATHPAAAERNDRNDPEDAGAHGDSELVIVNAAGKLGSLGQVSRISRVLDARGMLLKLPDPLAATLEGRNSLIADAEAIKDHFTRAEYDQATALIDKDEERLLSGGVADPMPALAELSQWRGLVFAGLGKQDEAIEQFRAAYRFNPAWTPDKHLVSPRVRGLVRQAHREPTETGRLRIDAEPGDATVAIDGGEARDAQAAIELPIGVHLATVTARGRKPYSELVDIDPKATYTLSISLDAESTIDRAARLVDESAAAPPGKARLKRARSLAKLTGTKRLLFVEDTSDDRITLRVYDVELDKVSKTLVLDDDASSALIARKITAALDPDNFVDAQTVIVRGPRARVRWYEHWYVWAGVAAVAGGTYLTYSYATREPQVIRGF